MPFITVELPEDVIFSFHEFSQSLHRYLSEALAIEIEKCKSKKVLFSEYLVGDDETTSFCRLSIELFKGRDKQKLQKIVQDALHFFARHILKHNPNSCYRISAEIRELDSDLLSVTTTK